MQIKWQRFTVHKRVPLTISRGTSSGSTNIWVWIEQDNLQGWGEASPFSLGSYVQTADTIEADLRRLAPALEPYHPLQHQAIEALLVKMAIGSSARAALDTALHDWLGKQVGYPLWQLWGADLNQISPTAVTIGISDPESAQHRLNLWLQQVPEVQSIKVKLGSPGGIAADQAMLLAVLKYSPKNAKVSVDANGGWSLQDSITMAHWLAQQGIAYIEQPLAAGCESDLPQLFAQSPLPLFADESCLTSRDIPPLADRVHGVNIKLMKSGGLTEATRMIATARACGLQVMFGCYSDSAIANTALAHLSALADHIDLDSHLNLSNDPFNGATMHHGCLIPNHQPGLGLTNYHAATRP